MRSDSNTTGHEEYEAALRFLLGRIDYERLPAVPYRQRNYRLDRMRTLLARLGDPQQGQKILHIAGTKGKGSTAAMLSSILLAAGNRVGTFSSPHLERIEERLAINGAACAADDFVRLVGELRPVVEQMDREAAELDEAGPTYFELTTALALLHFAQQQVDWTVLEVGLGGRLDSTNVCQPTLSLITSISLDHTRQLGDTLAAIAGEKAGIIKPDVPIISGVAQAEPRDVIRRIAREHDAPLIEVDVDYRYEHHALQPTADDGESPQSEVEFQLLSAAFLSSSSMLDHDNVANKYRLGLPGAHQASNAAVALAAIDQLRRQGHAIDEAAVRRGLEQVRLPGRIERVGSRPTIVVDAAHNVASTEALVATLEECYPAAGRRVLVFATSRDKDAAGMLKILVPRFDRVIVTRYHNNPRSVDPEELARQIADGSNRSTIVTDGPAAAWDAVWAEIAEEDLVCVTGSFFIAAEMRRLIAERPVRLAKSDVAKSDMARLDASRV